MSFNNDGQIVSPQDSERVQLTTKCPNIAPLEQSKIKVMLDITGGDSGNERTGAGFDSLVRDVKLVITHIGDQSTIEKVFARSYPQSKDDATGSVTITLGDLHSNEVRKVIVDLLLPAVENARGSDILEITYSFSVAGRVYEGNNATLTVLRAEASTGLKERQEVVTEEAVAVERVRLFSTPRMNKYLEQAKLFDENPTVDE